MLYLLDARAEGVFHKLREVGSVCLDRVRGARRAQVRQEPLHCLIQVHRGELYLSCADTLHLCLFCTSSMKFDSPLKLENSL